MNAVISTPPPGSFTDLEMLNFHWLNYQMRQSHFWKSFNHLVLALGTLWTIPFVKPQLFESLQWFILFFPFVALFLSITGRRLLTEEYKRLISVIKIIDELTPLNYKPDFPKSKWRIGDLIKNEICVFLIIISAVDMALVLAKVSKVILD